MNHTAPLQVIDDESDYFSHDSNRWLSSEGKEKLKMKEARMRAEKEKAKRSMTISLDFAGRTIRDYDATQDLEGMYDHGMVRVFRQKSTLEDVIGSHVCSLKRATSSIPLGCSLILPVGTL
jgi:hypothetical protein